MLGYPGEWKNPDRQRAGIALVVILHILMIYALNSASARHTLKVYQPPLEVKLIDENKPSPRHEVPLPQKFAVVVSKVYPHQVVLPQTIVTIAPVVSQLAITADHGDVSSEGTGRNDNGSAGNGQLPTAKIDARRPCPRPGYPEHSRPEEQQGTVMLKLLISADGEVLESAIDSSSGFPQLDEAARRALSRCLYEPPAADRNLARSWTSFKYRWRLE